MATVAILATDGFESSELTKPKSALEDAGHKAHVVSPESGTITGMESKEWADDVPVDVALADAKPDDYDALVLPGGVINPDALRMNEDAVTFVKSFDTNDKPIAAICHGPWTLINAEAVSGKRMTSWPSLQSDLENAGAEWVDESVVKSENLITSRNPDDIPDFCEALLETIA